MGFQGNGPGIGGYWHGKGHHRHPWSQVGRIMNYKGRNLREHRSWLQDEKWPVTANGLCQQGSSTLSTSHLLQLSLSASGHCCSVVHTCPTLLWPHGLHAAHQASLSFTISWSLLKSHVHWVGDAIHLILCRPLFLLPSLFPGIRVFSNKSARLQVVFPFPGPHPLGIIPSTLLRGLLNSSCWATFSALLLLLFGGYVVSNSLQPHGL